MSVACGFGVLFRFLSYGCEDLFSLYSPCELLLWFLPSLLKVIYHFYIFCSFSSKYKINPLWPLSSLPDSGFSLDKLLYFLLGSLFHLLQADVSEHRYYHLLL